MGKESWAEREQRVIPGGVNSGQRRIEGLEDLVVESTNGATFTDVHGRTYTDYHAAFGPPVLGHNDEDVDRAVVETARHVDLMGVGGGIGRQHPGRRRPAGGGRPRCGVS